MLQDKTLLLMGGIVQYSIFHDVGSAGNVRGKQVAELLGAKLNPKSGFEDDVCIYVKIRPPEKHPKKTYLDVDDATDAVKWLQTHTDTGVIANSSISRDYLFKLLKRNDVVCIPHIHCNYENWVRPDRKVKNVGIIGSKTTFQYPIDDIRKKLKEIGLDLIYHKDYWKVYGDEEGMTEDQRRMKVVDFYKQIDIQIVWRPDDTFSEEQKLLKNPNKLVNASSFGIPTVAYPEKGFAEWFGSFVSANNIEYLIGACDELKNNPYYYEHYSSKVLIKSIANHKDNILQLYLQL